MKQYRFLEPVKVGPTTLKNRVIMSGMAKYLCTNDGYITDEYVAHYAGIAKGGAALVTNGIMVIDPTWPYISKHQPYLDDDKYIPGVKRFVDAVHKEGAKAVCQLWHPGLSGTITADNPGRSINDFDHAEIRRIQNLYVNAARRSKQAGADAIEFHMAHTYLPSQFLSPYFNKRTDEYGSDTIENATRFSIECINRIRDELVDDNFFIVAKINGSDFIEGGTTPEWAAKACQLLEQAGVSMITVNGGGALTITIGMSDDGRQPEGWKIPFARAVKEAVSIPVAGCGSLRHPDYVDQILGNGDCDIVSLGRGLYAEPQWVNKAAEGREAEMRNCISCMFCFTVVDKGVSGCSVNPFAKRELLQPELIRDGADRQVAVIGAGPAGLEAAVTLAERGFKPVIYEKYGVIGGQTALAALPPDKQKIGWLRDYYNAQIDRLGIELHLNTEATIETIQKLDPYAIVLAAGSYEFAPPIEGLNRDHVVSVRDVLRNNPDISGKRVVVLGGGLTGLETARLLRHKGNSVTVLEMLPPNPDPNMETKLALQDAKDEGIVLCTEYKVLRITQDYVGAMDLTSGSEVLFPSDLVVVSLGIRPENKLQKGLEAICDKVIPVGDCKNCGKISSAVQSGCDAAYALC